MNRGQQLPVNFINYAIQPSWNQNFRFLSQLINKSPKITTQLFPKLSNACYNQ